MFVLAGCSAQQPKVALGLQAGNGICLLGSLGWKLRPLYFVVLMEWKLLLRCLGKPPPMCCITQRLRGRPPEGVRPKRSQRKCNKKDFGRESWGLYGVVVVLHFGVPFPQTWSNPSCFLSLKACSQNRKKFRKSMNHGPMVHSFLKVLLNSLEIYSTCSSKLLLRGGCLKNILRYLSQVDCEAQGDQRGPVLGPSVCKRFPHCDFSLSLLDQWILSVQKGS